MRSQGKLRVDKLHAVQLQIQSKIFLHSRAALLFFLLRFAF